MGLDDPLIVLPPEGGSHEPHNYRVALQSRTPSGGSPRRKAGATRQTSNIGRRRAVSSAAVVTGCVPDSVLTYETAVAGLAAVGIGAVMTLKAEADVGQQFVREQLGSLADPVVIVVGPQQQTLEERIPAVDRWPALAADRLAGQLYERIGRAGHASNRAASDQVSLRSKSCRRRRGPEPGRRYQGRLVHEACSRIAIRVDVEPHALVHRRQRERIVRFIDSTKTQFEGAAAYVTAVGRFGGTASFHKRGVWSGDTGFAPPSESRSGPRRARGRSGSEPARSRRMPGLMLPPILRRSRGYWPRLSLEMAALQRAQEGQQALPRRFIQAIEQTARSLLPRRCAGGWRLRW